MVAVVPRNAVPFPAAAAFIRAPPASVERRIVQGGPQGAAGDRDGHGLQRGPGTAGGQEALGIGSVALGQPQHIG